MKSISRVKKAIRDVWPSAYYSLRYRKTAREFTSKGKNRDEYFAEFMARCDGPCLQIAVKDEIGQKFGSNWTSVDKYDNSSYIDRNDDIEALDFPDESFNAVVCWSVLEHVPNPQRAVSELHRVLKPGGVAWVQLPFMYPHHAAVDYWRVTPMGLRQWMKNFEEVVCACDYWSRTKIVAATYYFGIKPKD